jgi:hypothetical protein
MKLLMPLIAFAGSVSLLVTQWAGSGFGYL